MAFLAYWVNDIALDKGDHVMHDETCIDLPPLAERTPLGLHLDCRGALDIAKVYHDHVNGCPRCCPDCRNSVKQ